MKATLLFATLSMVFAMPAVSAKTELETLRVRCNEQEMKIRQLEQQVQQLKGSQAETPARQTAEVTAPVEKSTSPAHSSYVVKAGDSVEKIARKNGCSVSNLTKINGLKPSSIIHPGQRLKLPGGTVEKSATPAKSQSDEAPRALASAPGKTHRIQQGETYASISRKYRIPVNTLIAANPGVKATALRPGMSIHLSSSATDPVAKKPESTQALATYPVDRKASSFEPVSEPVHKPKTPVATNTPSHPPTPPIQLGNSTTTPILSANPISPNPVPPNTSDVALEPAKAPTSGEAKLSPNPEKKIRSVKIDDQMTYGQFAAKHGTDATRLNDLNGLDLTTATVLAKGSELYVPAQP
jgi:LysM repeat protein